MSMKELLIAEYKQRTKVLEASTVVEYDKKAKFLAEEVRRREKELDDMRALVEEVKMKETELNDMKDRLARIKKDLAEAIVTKDRHTYLIEKKYDGVRTTIHKKGDEVRIFNSEGKDVTFLFPRIPVQAKKLSIEDFVIDCGLVLYDGREPLKGEVVAKCLEAAKSEKWSEGKTVFFYAFDCIYSGKNIADLRLDERKKVLNKMSFTDNIKKAGSIVVKNREDAATAINIFKVMRETNGVVVKRLDGKYDIGRVSTDWVRLGRRGDSVA